MSALQRVAPSGNDAEEELPKGGFSVGHGGNRQAGGGVPLTPDEKKEKRRVQNQKQRATQEPSTSQKISMVDHPAVLTAVMPKPDTHVTLKCCHKSNVCYFQSLTSPLWGCKKQKRFNPGSALYLLSEKVITLTEGITCCMTRLNFGL